MQLTIFLDLDDAKCLTRDVSDTSIVAQVVFRALRLRQIAGSESQDVIVVCDEAEGRELLRRAQADCSECVEKILRAFDLAGLIP